MIYEPMTRMTYIHIYIYSYEYVCRMGLHSRRPIRKEPEDVEQRKPPSHHQQGEGARRECVDEHGGGKHVTVVSSPLKMETYFCLESA